MAYIYATDRQVTDDVAVWQNIAKYTSWVRIWIRFARSSAHQSLALSLILDPGSRSVSLTAAKLDPFLTFSYRA